LKPCVRDETGESEGRVEELLKHLEKDFASQLVKTAVRQAEAGIARFRLLGSGRLVGGRLVLRSLAAG